MAPPTQAQITQGTAAAVAASQQQQQCTEHQHYQPPTRNLTDDEQKLLDALACIGINEVTRGAFFSLLGLPSMDGLAMFSKDNVKTLSAQMRDWIIKHEYECDGMELSAMSK